MTIENTFVNACKTGNLKKAKLLYKKNNNNIKPKSLELAIGHANNKNHFKVAQWLVNVANTNSCSFTCYYGACHYGNLEFLKWHMSMHNYKVCQGQFERMFEISCFYGNLHIAQWIYQVNPSINVFSNNGYAYNYACRNGHLEVAQWLKNTFGFNMLFYHCTTTFTSVCENGHLKVAQWLLTVQNNIQNEFVIKTAFGYACEHGHLEVAQWLLTIWNNLKHKTILSIDAYIIAKICRKGYFSVLKWLDTLSFINNLDCRLCMYYTHALCGGNINIAKWLINKSSTTLSQYNIEHAFVSTMEGGELYAAQWILLKHPTIDIRINNDIFEMFCQLGKYKKLKWILEMYKKRNISINIRPIQSGLKTAILMKNLNILQLILSEIPDFNFCYDNNVLFKTCQTIHIFRFLQKMFPFKYDYNVKRRTIKNPNVANVLCLLYILNKKKYTNFITPNFVFTVV